LWAYNERHLAFLEQYVGATLRETTLEAGNRSLASRLPRWIKSGQHREEVLAGLRRLRALLEE
jgi:Arc/MetJ family transcription regulator